MGGQVDTQLAVARRAQNDASAETSARAGELAGVSRLEEITPTGRIETRTAINRQLAEQQMRNRELADEINGFDIEPRNVQMARPAPTHTHLAGLDDRRRLERDLHDGVQNELVALMVHLAQAQEDPDTPPALAAMLAGLEARAQAALDSVRGIARGIYPPLLADFGVERALRAQAARGATPVRVAGTAPRSTEEAEEAVYFACSEASQNVAKHAGRVAQVTLELHHERKRLTVRIADDGRGFDPAHGREGAGLRNIRERIENLGGTLNVTSKPARGTTLTISLPWPRPADRRQ